MSDFNEPIPGASYLDVSVDLYVVEGKYFASYTDPLSGGTLAQQLSQAPRNELPQQLDAETWNSISSGWTFMKPAAPGVDLRKNAQQWGDFAIGQGPLAAGDLSTQQLMVRYFQGDFGFNENFKDLEFLNAYRQTDYYNSTTNKARQWSQSSAAERQVQVGNELATIAELWRFYTGQNVTLPETTAELSKNPVFKGWLTKAYQLAQGNISQARLLNQWLQPMAEDIEGSPWSRRLLEEERAGKQEVIDLETKKGEIRDVGNRYGLSLSNEMITKYGNDIINNELSDEELEQKLDEQSLVLYPNKPIGMDWVTYADPWRRVHAELYETSMPDHTDSDLAKALADGSSLSDYRTTIRKSNRWLGTENARDSLISELSLAGRRMGFG